ncbi:MULTISPECIES: NADPH:quinone reductase [unclassified Pseudomonas]|uniref:NADPH:quinone reductase n=1 Tax=unclassified Pseudomonas TaxID=196821 RepID=UPI000BD4F3FB|nr:MULTISPECIES: NADPH:quinone reductase [unclassified Pseudomonas]PVZ10573.1 NADPH:quinone reductase-like Zn-dependent oxidoreductase [Pseudomonas sp. URIL14HWK12:I12]PVZ21999.1 NADPH:quinone reductase-like Zn-dependent oxidoreductase [Pseudomonas sp. URIL14HWK12:I10]PVZ30918.1 NADPH:quinone reductase-like Zn-dependent oxidoreductase [Pseudomonas sp. URIL14HWK12:I11]SNZ17292.1 NADPH2:quinone reductase [Pseudomonas sp. URIL14HWK12:I9]
MAKRIQFDATGGPEVLQYVDYTPAEPGPNEVRVRNKAIGLNYIDTYFRGGLYPISNFPSGLGTEAAGEVEAVGSAVTHLKPGDRVAHAGGPLGAYSDVHVLPANVLVKLPEAISFEQAAAVMLKGLTVQYLMRQTYRVEAGETILFHAAAGGVGLLACQWAKALGAKVIGTVSSPEKAAKAKAAGAWEVIDYSHENVAQRVLELTDGKKCPVVYDGVGKDTWETSLDCVAPRGLLVSFGNASGAVSGVNLGVLASKGSLYVTRPTLATYAVPSALQGMADELFGMITSGKLNIEINQRYPLAEAAKAHTELSGRRTTGSTILLP